MSLELLLLVIALAFGKSGMIALVGILMPLVVVRIACSGRVASQDGYTNIPVDNANAARE